MAEDMKGWALRYADMGLAVLPIKPSRLGGVTPGKMPYIAEWQHKASTDREQIEKWWTRWPDANIGIATGHISGGLVVIDLDIDKDKGINGYESLKEWERENGELPETCQGITGRGGYHLLYRDSAKNRTRAGLYEGIDIRGEGGYFVAPPSLHENGRRYTWEQEPGEYSIAQADSKVIEFLQGPAPDPLERPGFELPDMIPEGQRTSFMIQLIGSLRAKGLDDEAIKAAVRVENVKKCIPPLTDQELERTVFPALQRGWKTENPYTAVYDNGKFRQQRKREKVPLVCVESVTEEAVEWLYCPYVPRGKVTLCAAYPGTGKTYLLCYMTACVTTGRSFFDIVPFASEPEKVIFLTSEDGIGDTIKKRLRICGARNVFTVTDKKNQLLFDSPEIEEYMREVKPALMIFDPFQSYIGSEVDMNAPNKTREQMGCIVELAEQYNVAVVIICHFNKNGKGDAITRVLGSTDIMGACRSYIALGTVPGEENMKFMSHEKSSLEKKGKTVLFEIDPDNGGIVALGQNSLSMDDYAAIRAKKKANNAPAIEAAKLFIVNNMPDGRRPSKELYNLAKANNISDRSMQRAREELGIISRKTKTFPAVAEWILPGHEHDEPVTMQESLDLQSDQSL